MLLSLVICTYNRADILKATLPSALALELPDGIELEILLVDNNSKDETSELVKKIIQKNASSIDMKYYFEDKQGLSFARNTGYGYAKGEYIIYTDDECILPKKWVVEAVKIIGKQSPAFLGGPYYGKYLPGSSSSWFKESYGDSYILQYDLPNGAMVNKYLSGGNLFIRRDVFEKIGLFDVELGMTGETISYGEEVDFQKRFIQKYPEEVIWYDQKVFLWHCIRNEKMKMLFLFKDALIRGASTSELQLPSRKQIKKSPLYLLYATFKAIRSFLGKFLLSILYKKKFFNLLYTDYKDTTWKDIGGAWYCFKLLLSSKNLE